MPSVRQRSPFVATIIIRPLHATDFDAIWPALRDAARAGEVFTYDPALDRDAAWEMWVTNAAASFVAECDGGVAGSYCLKPNAAGPGRHVANASYIVVSAARGRGIASAMCAHSVAAARDMGFLAMQFNAVVSTNTAAIAVWQKHGFAIVGTVPAAFRHATQGLVGLHVLHRFL